jgi:2-hydroxy-6-oxonona-2,4-dienedioate hydrolase
VTSLHADTLTVDGLSTRILRGGQGAGTPIVFLHGGVPGITPYCGGSHVWGPVLSSFAAERPVIAYDLPGSGGTPLPAGELPSIDRWSRHLLAVLDGLGVPRCDLVGHQEGGLLALSTAIAASERVRSVAVIASRAAGPTGDMVEDITFASPPAPLWGRVSQAWALDRIAYTHHHIDGALLDACVAIAEANWHAPLAEAMRSAGYFGTYVPSVNKAKARFYEACRGGGIPVPVQVVWASHDPLSPPARGIVLFKDIAARQPKTVFSLINRSGSLIFREQPQDFFRAVSGFHDSLDAG